MAALTSLSASPDVLLAKCEGEGFEFRATRLANESIEASLNGEVTMVKRMKAYKMIIYKSENYHLILMNDHLPSGEAIATLVKKNYPGLVSLSCVDGEDVKKITTDSELF